MVEEHHGYGYGNMWAPIGAPMNTRHQQQQQQRDEQSAMRDFDSSVNAVSFGFVATAILISMFLVMAIFERFLRPASPDLPPSGRRSHPDLEAQLGFNPKLGRTSPKMTIYASEVSVLMPGDDIPTFIAHPAPVPCPPDRVSWPLHQPPLFPNPYSNTPLAQMNSNLQAEDSHE